MKKQLLSVLFVLFSLCNVVYASDADSTLPKKMVPPPVNDECNNAINIPISPELESVYFVSGTTTEATPTFTEFSMHECNDYAPYSNDVWFEFTATEKKHILNFSDIQGADGQLYYIVYSGNDCNNLTPVYCHFTSYTLSSMAQDLVAGANYKIRVMTASSSNLNATFSISITTPTPVINDECSATIMVPVSPGLEVTSLVTGNLLGATGSTFPNGCFDDVLMDDMWYSFIATSTQHAIKIFDYSDGDAFIFDFFSGTTCNDAVHLSCSSNTLNYINNLVIGDTYRIKVSNGSSSSGNTTPLTFSLSVITPPIIPNDECNNATSIPVNNSLAIDAYVTGTSRGATMSSQQVPCSFSGNDIWYEFMATSVTHILNFFDVNESIVFLGYSLNRGDCDELMQMSCGNKNSKILNSLIPGTVYKVRVQNTLDNTFLPDAFKIAITTPPVPSNDNCENAIDVPVNPTGTSSLFVSGTTYAASKSPQISICPGPRIDDVWFSFTATNPIHILKLYNLQGTAGNLRYFVSSGDDCEAIYEAYCANSSSNPTLILNNLTIGSSYKFRVSSSSGNPDQWATFDLRITTPPPVTNDECATAILINTAHNSSTFGSVCGATPSLGASNNCQGTEDDDVWYKFVASSNKHIVTVTAILQPGLSFAVYSGNCDSMSLLGCSPANLAPFVNSNYVIGQTYFVRVWSIQPTIVDMPFTISLKIVSTCQTAEPFCGSTPDDPYIFANTTSIPSAGAVGCLTGAPNPTFYTLKVSESGPIVYSITQNSAFDVLGNPIGLNMDVDFIAWGPFESASSCEQIAMSGCPSCPNNTSNPTFYPYTNILDCSYDASYYETLTIPNAIAGQYYVVLITNFNGSPGYIKLTQTNSADPNAGQTACADKIQLVAFVDANGNGIKDESESNFSNGAFTYKKNNIGTTNYLSSPLGIQSIYDENPANTYDFNYEINSEYGAYYAATPTNFNDLNIPVGSGTQTLYFPITVTQSYTDVEVSLISVDEPRPGFEYNHKILFKNKGTLATSGVINYNKENSNVQISEVLPAPTSTSPTGFTFNYANLLPGEVRSINIKMLVASIPAVNLDDQLTSSVNLSTVENDINSANNSFTTTQTVVGSYDPNDKNEARGSNIEISQFNQDDYLFYTIRFQNTGTASAYTVRIEDTLEEEFDFASVRMISASHNYSLERINNRLIWTFNNINLPGVFQNEALSHGYVTFKVKLNAGFAVGDIIENTAEIYFDTNPSIITNTFSTEFVETLGNQQFTSSNITIYPNPSNGLVYINAQNTNESLKEINLYDVLGKIILSSKNLTSKQSTIDVSAFAKGVYMIEITTENNLRQIKKLVVN